MTSDLSDRKHVFVKKDDYWKGGFGVVRFEKKTVKPTECTILLRNKLREIIFNIDVVLTQRKMSMTELSEKVGITLANMSILKAGKAKAIKASTLAKLCEALNCQLGDLLEYRQEE